MYSICTRKRLRSTCTLIGNFPWLPTHERCGKSCFFNIFEGKMFARLLMLSTYGAAPGLHDCPTSNISKGHSACPADATCCTHEYFGAPGCVFAGTTECCAPGPALEPSTTLPNCLIIGDSVSDQYTPSVADLLSTTCQVQHAPWVGGGESFRYLACLTKRLDK